MDLEYEALMRNQTWELVPMDPIKNVVDCKWLFLIKEKADGSIDRYKVRLVAKGLQNVQDWIFMKLSVLL